MVARRRQGTTHTSRIHHGSYPKHIIIITRRHKNISWTSSSSTRNHVNSVSHGLFRTFEIINALISIFTIQTIHTNYRIIIFGKNIKMQEFCFAHKDEHLVIETHIQVQWFDVDIYISEISRYPIIRTNYSRWVLYYYQR